jgi:hypothetical protein
MNLFHIVGFGSALEVYRLTLNIRVKSKLQYLKNQFHIFLQEYVSIDRSTFF